MLLRRSPSDTGLAGETGSRIPYPCFVQLADNTGSYSRSLAASGSGIVFVFRRCQKSSSLSVPLSATRTGTIDR